MRVSGVLGAFAFVVCTVVPGAGVVSAQATRTWVSGVGDDANPCSRTAPCKTFAGAISKTAAAGVISVLDPGGYGAVTISKSITIEGDGSLAGVLAVLTNGITVNGAATDQVVLRNLLIEGVGSGLNGIRYLGGLSLAVEGCVIDRFTEKGIDVQLTSGNGHLFVRNTTIRNNNFAAGGAIYLKPAAGATVTATLDNVLLERNAFGVKAEAGATVAVNGGTVTRSAKYGLWALTTTSPARIHAKGVVVSHSGLAGVMSNGTAALVTLSDVGLLANAAGLTTASSGQVLSFGNNTNTDSGAPTGLLGLQ